MNLKEQQTGVLCDLLSTAADTEQGRRYGFSGIEDYETFRKRLPLTFYGDISSGIERLKKGAADIWWPGNISDFALSAGTSGEGKHLPVTAQRLQSDRRYMRKLAADYLRQRPNIFRLAGRHVSLPGRLEKRSGYRIGEISAFTASGIPWWLSPFQLIPAGELVRLPFDEKIDRILKEAAHGDIRVISCAPSWLLTIFQRMLQKTGAGSIHEIWPDLALLVCGGVKLANYRPHLEKLLGTTEADFIETYGASEGYFSYTDDLGRSDMRLVIDNGIFYEFIPNPLPGDASLSIQETVPLWEVESGVPCAVVVTTNGGLWRYALNDIVTFTRTDIPRIEVMGRVNEMLDDFGEALYAFEAEQALERACGELGLRTGTFTVAASLSSEHQLPRHLWFVQCPEPVHRDTLDRLADRLDSLLQQKNRHYAVRRQSGALDRPGVNSISQQQINLWLERKGRDKAQGKLPSVLRDERDIRFFR